MLSQDLFEVLSHSQGLAKKRKDILTLHIGPLSRLWRIARFQQKMPPEIKLSSALNRIGYRKMGLSQDDRSGTLKTPGMVLDLGHRQRLRSRQNGGNTEGQRLEQMLDRCGRRPGVRRPGGTRGWRVEIGGLRHQDLPVLHFVKPRGCHFRGSRTVRSD